MKKDYNRGYFENVSGYSRHGGYGKMHKEIIMWYNGIFEVLKKKGNIDLKQGNGEKVLDVGCAYGYILSELNKKNFKTYGMDISQYAVKIAKQLNKTSRIDVGDIHHLVPFRSKFDFILCLEVLEHLQTPEDAIKNMYSSLKKGGFLIITTPNPSSKSCFYFPYKDPTHISLKNSEEWVKLMKIWPFERIDSWGIHAIPLSKYFTGKVGHIAVPESLGGTILIVCKK
jgi:SAM-dependent methyltransferase